MHSQNCSFLPSKKQTSFNTSLPHNIGLLRNFSSKAFSQFDSATRPSVYATSPCENLNTKQQSRTGSIMDIVYRFSDSSRLNLRQTASNMKIPTEKSRPSCKHLISNYNSVTQMPLMSSHLVGGFVGSKSQLGRRPTHGFGFSIWDIIRELVDVVGNSSANTADKGTIRKNSFLNNKCPSLVKVNTHENFINMNKNSSLNSRPVKLKDTNNCQKQSYADVTKIKLELPEITSIEIASRPSIDDHDKCLKVCKSKPVLEHFSLCSGNDNRSRIASECSLDSEDSLIVFEYCEGDDISVDSDCTSSDDESVVDFQIIKGASTSSEGCSSPTKRSHDPTPKGKRSSGKRVRFAEGRNLVQVHPMVVWNYAHRAARIGPWEMMARDAERFRIRIAKAESILTPIFDPVHRDAVFQERFAHLDTLDDSRY